MYSWRHVNRLLSLLWSRIIIKSAFPLIQPTVQTRPGNPHICWRDSTFWIITVVTFSWRYTPVYLHVQCDVKSRNCHILLYNHYTYPPRIWSNPVLLFCSGISVVLKANKKKGIVHNEKYFSVYKCFFCYWSQITNSFLNRLPLCLYLFLLFPLQ